MYNFASILFGGICALAYVALYLLFTDHFVIAPFIDAEDSSQKSGFPMRTLWSGIIACGIIFVIIFIHLFFALSLETKLILLTFMISAALSICVIVLWIGENKNRLAKLNAKWYVAPILISGFLTFVVIFIMAMCAL